MKNVFIVLLFFVFNNNVFCQDTISTRLFGNYIYQNEKYKAKDLKEILIKDEEAFLNYQKYKEKRKNGIILLSTSSLGVVLYYGFFEKENRSDSESPDVVNLYGMLAGGALAISFGYLGLDNLGSSKRHLKKSIDVYNGNITIPKTGSTPMELNLKYSGTGIGLFLNF